MLIPMYGKFEQIVLSLRQNMIVSFPMSCISKDIRKSSRLPKNIIAVSITIVNDVTSPTEFSMCRTGPRHESIA